MKRKIKSFYKLAYAIFIGLYIAVVVCLLTIFSIFLFISGDNQVMLIEWYTTIALAFFGATLLGGIFERKKSKPIEKICFRQAYYFYFQLYPFY